MFGFSLQKLALLVAIVAAVWYGFKLVKQLQDARELEARNQGNPRRATAGRRRGKSQDRAADAQDAEQMVQCPVCGTYVPASRTPKCDRPSCPY